MAAETSGGGCEALSTTGAGLVGDAGDRLAHSSELDVVMMGDAANVGGPLRHRLADAALRAGELGGLEHVHTVPSRVVSGARKSTGPAPAPVIRQAPRDPWARAAGGPICRRGRPCRLSESSGSSSREPPVATRK